MLWFKGSRQIPFVNTERYTFENGATTLVINQFDRIDAGSYLFVYANNVTRTRVLFHLDLRASSGKFRSVIWTLLEDPLKINRSDTRRAP